MINLFRVVSIILLIIKYFTLFSGGTDYTYFSVNSSTGALLVAKRLNSIGSAELIVMATGYQDPPLLDYTRVNFILFLVNSLTFM
jgi:hypothetical protein